LTREELEEDIRRGLRADIHGDIYNYESFVDWIMMEFQILQSENERLKRRISDMSWDLNPDKSGGQFTQEELNRGDKW